MDARPGGARSRARWRRWALLVPLALALGTFGLEAALRVLDIAPPQPRGRVGAFPPPKPTDFVPDPEIGWRMRPDHSFTWSVEGRDITYSADGEGFRCDPAAAPRQASRWIAVVGDSNAWGHGVELSESFGGLVESALDDVRVRTFGMPGFGLDQVWQTLRHHVLPRRPDLVIVGIVRDDFRRSLFVSVTREGIEKPAFTLEDGRLRRLTPEDRLPAPLEWLERHTHLWTAWHKVWIRAGYRYRVGRWWTLNAAILDAIRADCAAAEVPVLFVRLPAWDDEVFDSLGRYMRETGAHYVDPFDTPLPGEGALFTRDRHVDARGHRWVARSLLGWLERHL